MASQDLVEANATPDDTIAASKQAETAEDAGAEAAPDGPVPLGANGSRAPPSATGDDSEREDAARERPVSRERNGDERSGGKSRSHPRGSASRERSRPPADAVRDSRDAGGRGRDSRPRDRDYRSRDYRDRDYRDYRDRDYRSRDYRDYRDYRDRDYRDYRDRDGGRGYGRGGRSGRDDPDPRRSPSPAERAARAAEDAEREAAEAARDEMTVLVQRVHPRADDFELFEFFSQAGTVNDIRLIKDPRSGRSKGVAYVEFADAESVLRAMALNGIAFMGQPLLVQASMAERNRAAQAAKKESSAAKAAEGAAAGASGLTVQSSTKLTLRNVPPTVSESDLREVLAAFGPLTAVNIVDARPEGDRRPCSANAEFAEPVDAATALQALSGYQLAGYTLKVEFAQVPAVASAPPSAPALQAALGVGGVPLIPTESLVVQNMFDPNGEEENSDPHFFPDLLEDVVDECAKFGKVTDAFLDPQSQGCVYLKFVQMEDSARAALSLTGRWFAGKQLSTRYLTPIDFDAATAEPHVLRMKQ